MASIVKRGKTYSVVYYEGEGKKRQQKWESGLTYSAAKAMKAKIEHEQAQQTAGDESKNRLKEMTISEFLYEFIEKYGYKKWAASTYDGNVGLLENYVHPHIGDKKLLSLTTKMIDDYYDFLEKEAEPATNMGKPTREHITASTIHDIHKILRCAFNLAVRWDYRKKNPFLNATLPEHKEQERVVLEPNQILKVLKYTCRPDNYDYYLIHCAVLIAIGCTIRGGEIGGLQWDRVHYEKMIFHIDRAIDRISKKNLKLPKVRILFKFPNLIPGAKTCIVLKKPKTDNSARDVDVPQMVLNSLQILRQMQEKLKAELGSDGYIDYNLVICQANGRPMMTEHLNKRFKEILVEMNDPEIKAEEIVFHSLRHTSATAKLFVSQGDFNSVMQAGGWANLEMLTRRYGKHSFQDIREKLAHKMDDFLGNGLEEAIGNDGGTGIAQPGAIEQALQTLFQTNPDLLIQVIQSVQSANKE